MYGIVTWQWPGRHIKWTREAQSPDLYQAVLDLLLPGIRPYGLVTTISQVRNGTALKQEELQNNSSDIKLLLVKYTPITTYRMLYVSRMSQDCKPYQTIVMGTYTTSDNAL